MKTWKQGIIGLLVIFALAFVACDDKNNEPPEQPEYREKEITLNFNVWNGPNESIYEYNIMVSGILLANEWKDVPGKVKSTLEASCPTNLQTMDDLVAVSLFMAIFAKTGANVIVEKTTAYPNYKIVGDGITLYLRFSVLNSISSEIILDALKRMEVNETYSN